MALETLVRAQMEAGLDMGLPRNTIEDILADQQVTVHNLGSIPVAMDEGTVRYVEAKRGHSGPEGTLKKGGSRITDSNPWGNLEELPVEMGAKNAQMGLVDIDGNPVDGGKLVIAANPHSLSHTEKQSLFGGIALSMHRLGIAGYGNSVPAGDMGTNHPDYMDAFAWTYHQANPEDPNWRASITGTSANELFQGLEFRTKSTGYGVYRAINFAAEKLGDKEVYDLSIGGAGNVGGWAAYFADKHRETERDGKTFRIKCFSDQHGTIIVDGLSKDPHAEGIRITEKMVEEIFDNANFKDDARWNNNKIAAIVAAVKENQPDLKFTVTGDPNDLLAVPVDIAVPAAVPNVYNARTVGYSRARAIVEAGNGTTTAEADIRLRGQGTLLVPDTAANALGVFTSMIAANRQVLNARDGMPMPDEAETQHMVRTEADWQLDRMARMAELLDTDDNRKACSGLSIGNLALRRGENIDHELRQIIKREAALQAV